MTELWKWEAEAQLRWYEFCDDVNYWLHCKRGYHKLSGPHSMSVTRMNEKGKYKTIKTAFNVCMVCRSIVFTSDKDRKNYLKIRENDRKNSKRFVDSVIKKIKVKK